MINLKSIIKNGSTLINEKGLLSANQLKLIAVVIMTLDHIGYYSFYIPPLLECKILFTKIGRIAAPIFLYMVTESARYTHDRKKYMFRLYLGAVGYGLTFSIYNIFFNYGLYHADSNIFFTLLYVVLYIHIIENIIKGVKEKDAKKIYVNIIITIITFLLVLVKCTVYEEIYILLSYNGNIAGKIFENLYNSFICSPLEVTYSFIFVIMGISMYFSKAKIYKCIVYFIFCIISVSGAILGISGAMFDFYQYYMIFALPFMLLYNGKQGINLKWFYYIYFTSHILIIRVLFKYIGKQFK